jgi:hypothetical protein
LWKKREKESWPNTRETRAIHMPRAQAKFFRLNFMHNPPPQYPLLPQNR